ncbi:MAG: tetratricopeptide repeat protein [Thermodesulfobacteriota bacterium]
MPIILGVVIFVVSVLVYLTAIPNGFVHDDHFYLERNELIKDLTNLPRIFFSSSWSVAEGEGVGQYYRPMSHIVYTLVYHAVGLKASAFHLVNVLLHAAASVVVFLTATFFLNGCRMNVGSEPGGEEVEQSLFFAFAAALLFASHPLHTEAVVWIAAVTEMTFSLFFLLSFYLYITTPTQRGRVRYGLSLLCFFLSAISKETAATLPPLLVAYDLAIRREPLLPVLPWVRRYAGFVVIGIIYYLLRVFALGEVTPLAMDPNIYGFLINVPIHFVLYLEKMIWPVNLLNYYELDFATSILEGKSLIALFFTGIFFAAVAVSYKKSRTVFFLLLWIFLPLIPTFFVALFKKEATFSERYTYIPSFAYLLLVVMACKATLAREMIPKRLGRPIVVVIFLTITIFYSIGTVERNYAWRSDLTLWQDAVQKPYAGRVAFNNLGNEYARRDQLQKALDAYTASLKLDPDYGGAHNGIGIVYAKRGFFDDAEWYFRRALALEPGQPEATGNLEKILGKQNGK